MEKNTAQVPVEAVVATDAVHPLHVSHRFISTRNINLNNLTAFESVAMSLALVLAVTAALAMNANIFS